MIACVLNYLFTCTYPRSRLWCRRGGHLYVCGGTAMGADVQAALLKVVAGRITGGGSAANYVANLKAQGRYVQELWA